MGRMKKGRTGGSKLEGSLGKFGEGMEIEKEVKKCIGGLEGRRGSGRKG